jgi:hypothetical protein
MKMNFIRNESGETQVQLVENGIDVPFNYITLVKHLIKNAGLETSTFGESFTAEEKAAVNSMEQSLINACKMESQEVESETY